MKKMRITALLLALVMLLGLTACGVQRIEIQVDQLEEFLSKYAGNESVQPVPDTTAAPVETPTAPPATEATTAADPAATTAPSGETTTAAPAPTQPAPANNGAPSTKAEIIKYYVTAYNKMATDAKSFTRTYDYTSNYNNIVEVNNNERLAGLAQTLMNQFMKEDFTEVPGDAAAVPPVGVSTLSISESQVGEASIVDNGATYTVTLTSTGTDANPEADLTPGQGSAGVIGLLLRTEDVAGAAGSLIKFDGLHAYYPTGKVVATIDKASGHITNLEFANPCILHFDSVTALVVVKISNANIGLYFQQKWTIGY